MAIDLIERYVLGEGKDNLPTWGRQIVRFEDGPPCYDLDLIFTKVIPNDLLEEFTTGVYEATGRQFIVDCHLVIPENNQINVRGTRLPLNWFHTIEIEVSPGFHINVVSPDTALMLRLLYCAIRKPDYPKICREISLIKELGIETNYFTEVFLLLLQDREFLIRTPLFFKTLIVSILPKSIADYLRTKRGGHRSDNRTRPPMKDIKPLV